MAPGTVGPPGPPPPPPVTPEGVRPPKGPLPPPPPAVLMLANCEVVPTPVRLPLKPGVEMAMTKEGGAGLGGGEAAVNSCPPKVMATPLVPVGLRTPRLIWVCCPIAVLRMAPVVGNGVGKPPISGVERMTCPRSTVWRLGAPPLAPITASCPGAMVTDPDGAATVVAAFPCRTTRPKPPVAPAVLPPEPSAG